MTTLLTLTRPNVSLADALADLPPGDAVALVYAPTWCGFARLAGGQLIGLDRTIPADAFEVRAFHAAAELRWLKDPSSAAGTGRAALLTEAEMTRDGWRKAERAWESVTDTIPATYLLWGQGTGSPAADGWSVLGLTRIGALPVPVAGVGSKDRVVLHAVEYVAEDEYGSAFVCEERLTRLTIDRGTGRG